MKKIFLFSLLAIGFVSCDKDDVNETTCSDGYQNGGETGLDCGGPCAPCGISGGTEYFYAHLEDSNNVFQNIEVLKIIDTFYFQVINDFTTLNFGVYFIQSHATGDMDSALMVPNSYEASFGAAEYKVPVVTSGDTLSGAIMVEDFTNNLLEGNFHFTVTNASGNDTVQVVNGQFYDVSYE